jgi:thymidylate synthase (FAD)
MKTTLKVQLIAYTPEPEKVVSAAAKLCYSNAGAVGIMENLDVDKQDKFLAMLVDMGHMSPVEHVSFTFAVEGVSRALTHQLVRHRIASYSQKSQRYVREGQFDYVVPDAIERDEAARAQFINAMQEAQEAYDAIAEALKEQYLKEGMSARTAEKTAIEDARYVLPNACESKIVFTMNARELIHFSRLRGCNRAQWEIRQLCEKVTLELKNVAPTLFKLAGPSCLLGPCPEGKLSCGQAAQMRKRYGVG